MKTVKTRERYLWSHLWCSSSTIRRHFAHKIASYCPSRRLAYKHRDLRIMPDPWAMFPH